MAITEHNDNTTTVLWIEFLRQGLPATRRANWTLCPASAGRSMRTMSRWIKSYGRKVLRGVDAANLKKSQELNVVKDREIHTIDVGQGESSLITTRNIVALLGISHSGI